MRVTPTHDTVSICTCIYIYMNLYLYTGMMLVYLFNCYQYNVVGVINPYLLYVFLAFLDDYDILHAWRVNNQNRQQARKS